MRWSSASSHRRGRTENGRRRLAKEIFEKSDFQDIQAVREVLPTADFAGPHTIFNIKGNSHRLNTVIHYRCKRVYIKGFMTHAEYN